MNLRPGPEENKNRPGEKQKTEMVQSKKPYREKFAIRLSWWPKGCQIRTLDVWALHIIDGTVPIFDVFEILKDFYVRYQLPIFDVEVDHEFIIEGVDGGDKSLDNLFPEGHIHRISLGKELDPGDDLILA